MDEVRGEAVTQRLDLIDWPLRGFRELVTPLGIGLAAGFALLFFVATGLAVPWVLRRLPADALEHDAPPSLSARGGPGKRLWIRILKNLLGSVLLIAGVAMLFLPGQGLVTLTAALILLDFPGKWRLTRAVLGAPPVFRVINKYRAHNGLEALRPPADVRRRGTP